MQCYNSTSVHLCTTSLQNLTVLQDFYYHQYLCGTILVAQYLMMWDYWVSRAEPKTLHWPSCSLPFCLLFFLSRLSFYGLVLWGLGSRTDMVLIALSPILALPTFFNNQSLENLGYLSSSFSFTIS